MRHFVRAIAMLLVVLVCGCEATPAPPTGSAGSAEWVERLRQFEEGYFARNPPFAVQKGRHEFDGRLPDWSATGIRATVQWLHAQRTQAEAFDQNALSAEQRFERQYLLAQIDTDLFWLDMRSGHSPTQPTISTAASIRACISHVLTPRPRLASRHSSATRALCPLPLRKFA